ncbi:hypothetical protein MA04_01439 [Alcanivorax balearicus MACL04]|uniref:Pilus assembly protein n=1 Tax=Alloalcanivorax balearicus MACL04 TaxID=1177182 RepID=A0ABT2QX88_9GAMM|nr:hypothetical protein [Alloalcanivorax balearicus]MCU5782139.1 hypothetical protein [Alloalcanivorax balearicus MACL04]
MFTAGRRDKSGKERGAVALEFLVLFPLIFSLIYAAGVYGVLFSWQVRMQIAVDRATASVMHLDRNGTDEPDVEALKLANDSVAGGLVPEFMGSLSTEACYHPPGADDQVVCTLKVVLADGGCADGQGAVGTAKGPGALGFWGGFPPMPDCLQATAKVVY